MVFQILSITFWIVNIQGSPIWLFLLARPANIMNEQDSKSAADYERELKERQRLLASSPHQKILTDLDYISHETEEPGQYILEYIGGRRVLVEIDEATGKQYFLREL
jgi:hypothetical protein